jgi:hypothetical protein
MIPDAIETFKDAMLRTFAAQLRAERPGLTHARSFQLAQEQHPDLAEEWPEEANPSPMPAYTPPPPGKVASSGYRYDPEKKHTASKKTSWDDVRDLLLNYISRQRLEATPPPDDEPPSKKNAIKVYGQGIPL